MHARCDPIPSVIGSTMLRTMMLNARPGSDQHSLHRASCFAEDESRRNARSAAKNRRVSNRTYLKAGSKSPQDHRDHIKAAISNRLRSKRRTLLHGVSNSAQQCRSNCANVVSDCRERVLINSGGHVHLTSKT